MATDQLTVLVLIFDGFNTLDVNGPMEVLGNYALRQHKGDDPVWCPFKILIASKNGKPVKAFESIHMAADISYSEATSMIENKEIDILITPGSAPPSVIDNLIKEEDEIFKPMKAFLNLKSNDRQRWMISVCVGALLNAHVGAFDDRYATTHYAALQKLKEYSDNKANVVRQRWVDGGESPNGIRIVSSGGISCGIDCMLWFIWQILGFSSAQSVATMMEYAWRIQ